MKTIKLGDVLTDGEIESLTQFLKSRSSTSRHNLILKWLDDNPAVMKKAYKAGFIKQYFAYCLDFALMSKQ